MLVSFVLPHKGREELIERAVASIVAQDYDLSELEITIVTQNTTLASDFQREKELVSINIVFRPDNETISALRNTGVEHSSGHYLAFLDADVVLSANWVKAMLSELEDNTGRVLVSAVQRCENNAPPLEKIRTALSNATIDSEVQFLPGRNLLLKKETFAEVGGFPEHLVTCEDYYFTDLVHELGQLYYSSEADYVHLGEDKNYKELFNKEIWRGQSNLQSVKGRRIPLSELPSFLVPVWILLFAVMTLIASAFLSEEYAMLGLGLFFFPILLYSARLYKIADKQISVIRIAQFYLVYFVARTIGTISGLFKVVKV
mgnify:FL=1